MNNPFHRASAKLAAIGQQILAPQDSLGDMGGYDPSRGDTGANNQHAGFPSDYNAASISIGDSRVPLAFAIVGNLSPRISVNSSNVTLKPVWGDYLDVSDWLVNVSGSHEIVPPEPLMAGLYELCLDSSTKMHFMLYNPEFPHVQLQVEESADIPTHREHVSRSPDQIGCVFKQIPTDIEISNFCRGIPILPVSYMRNMQFLVCKKLSRREDSYELVNRMKQSPLIKKAFIPGERLIIDGPRPGQRMPVMIDREDFQLPPAAETPQLTLS